MSEKSKSTDNKTADQKPVVEKKSSEKDEMREILEGINAFQYHKIAEMFENRQKNDKKAEDKKETKKKPDEDGDGVPDWADKKPGKDDHKKEEKESSKMDEILQKAEKTIAGKIFAQTVKRLLNAGEKKEVKKEAKPVITAKFEKKDDLKASTWTISSDKQEKPLLVATLGDIWGDELETQDQGYILGDEYAKDLVSYYNKEGLDKTANLLGVKAYEQTDVKDSKVSTPKKQEFKTETNAKEEKAAEKSSEAVGKDEEEVGSHMEPEKEILEASKKKEASKECPHCGTKKGITDGICDHCEKRVYKKKASNEKKADESVMAEPPAEPAVEEPVAEEPKPEVPETEEHTEESEKTLFDEVEKVVVGDGYEAYKDKETGEICIKDAQGQEVKRVPDAFGHDMPAAIELLRSLVDLPPSAEMKPEEAPAAEQAPVEDKPQEEPADLGKEDAGMYASKEKENISKEAEEIKKQKEALDQEKRALEAQKAEIIAKQFGSSVNSRVAKCRKIVEAMVERGMLTIDEEVCAKHLDNDVPLLEAREAGLRYSADRQLEALLAMDEISLESFAKSVNRVEKKASKGLKTAVHMPFTPADQRDDDSIDNIFNSMGSLKGHTLNEFDQ